MRQYLAILRKAVEDGDPRTDRTGVGTRAIFGETMRFRMADGIERSAGLKMVAQTGVTTALDLACDPRSLVLSVPSVNSLAPSQVHVSENAKPVTGAVLRSISHAGEGDFGVVLAIDVSPSMHGQPLENAMSAARSLAAQRVGQQQLGVLLFDQSSTTLLPLTTSQPAI